MILLGRTQLEVPEPRLDLRLLDRVQELQARLARRAEPGNIPRLPSEQAVSTDGRQVIQAPWVDLTDMLGVDYLNAVSHAVPADAVGAFEQVLLERGAVENLNVEDLRRPIPLFGTPGVGVAVFDQGPVIGGLLRGGGEYWIQRRRVESGGQLGPLPDRRAGSITEYITINFSDIVRVLASRTACIQEGHPLLECDYPTLLRIGDPAVERYSYALNRLSEPGGLPPGSQVDISILLRADRYTGIDWLVPRHLPPSPVDPLEVDGVFAGVGVISNRPSDWPAEEASIFAVAAGQERAVLGQALDGERGLSIADGGAASLRISGGLRTLKPFSDLLAEGGLGAHEGDGVPQEPRSLIDGLQAAGVDADVLRGDQDRADTLSDFGGGWRPEGRYYRFTLSVVTLPIVAWPLPYSDGATKYRYSVKASVKYAAFNEEDQRHRFRSYVFQPPIRLHRQFPPTRGGGADPRQLLDVQEAVNWETKAGTFGILAGGFSHATPSGGRLRFTVENVSARLYFRGLPDLNDQRHAERYIDPGVRSAFVRF